MTWLDAFFDHYYRRRPVNATFTGVHAYDDRLPDLSEQGVADTCAEMEALETGDWRLETEGGSGLAEGAATSKAQTEEADVSPVSNLQSPISDLQSLISNLDILLARNYLTLQLAEFRSGHFHRRNPAVYTGEAIFGVISLFLRDFAPLDQRVENAIARLHAIPTLLAQGQANLQSAPREWTLKALKECQGAYAFLGEGVDLIGRQPGVDASRLRAAADVARAAFHQFERFLRDELLPRGDQEYACGAEMFDLYMRLGHGLDMDGAAVADYAGRRLAEIKAQVEAAARRLRPDGDWRAILASLPDSHPDPAGYYAAFARTWEACRRMAEEHDLVTWPDYPLRYAPVPAPFRAAAPHLYFLPYRSPAPFDPVGVYTYLVPPLDPAMSQAEQEARVRAVNRSVIKLNHVVHHGAIGHHVQNWYAYHAASRIGQVAAVDTALRIGMFCGGTLAEGWACYVTDLMGEVGFYTPEEAFAQLHSTLRQAARAVVDSHLHLGRMTLKQAAQFYVDQAGMPPDAARAEAVKNAMFPGAAMMYLVGTDMVHDLRRQVAAREGAAFSLRRFHDRFLSYGAIPVALIAEDMLK